MVVQLRIISAILKAPFEALLLSGLVRCTAYPAKQRNKSRVMLVAAAAERHQ